MATKKNSSSDHNDHGLQVFPVHPLCPTGLEVAGPKMAPEAEGAMRGRWGAGLEVKGRSREGGKGHTATTEASPCQVVTVMSTRSGLWSNFILCWL